MGSASVCGFAEGIRPMLKRSPYHYDAVRIPTTRSGSMRALSSRILAHERGAALLQQWVTGTAHSSTDIKRASSGARVVKGFHVCVRTSRALSGGGAYVRVHGRHHPSRGRALTLRTKNAHQVPLPTLRCLRWDCLLRPLRASACSRGAFVPAGNGFLPPPC